MVYRLRQVFFVYPNAKCEVCGTEGASVVNMCSIQRTAASLASRESHYINSLCMSGQSFAWSIVHVAALGWERVRDRHSYQEKHLLKSLLRVHPSSGSEPGKQMFYQHLRKPCCGDLAWRLLLPCLRFTTPARTTL